MNDTLTQALELAERGYHLFPLVPGGKTPALTGNWQNAATREPRTLQRWFARSNCNIAVACEPSGIFAIDLDTAKPGADGPYPRHRNASHARRGPRPPAHPDRRHTQRRHPPLLPPTHRRLPPAELRPPPRPPHRYPRHRRLPRRTRLPIDGVPYRITDDVPLAEIPAWITMLLRPPEPELRSAPRCPPGPGGNRQPVRPRRSRPRSRPCRHCQTRPAKSHAQPGCVQPRPPDR
jgi:hypothetical protein